MLVARTTASVRFDAKLSSNGNRSAFAPAVGVARSLGIGAIRMELSIVQKGFERTQPTFHWTYLELPVLFELRGSAESSRLRPVLHFGVAPSLALRCSVTYVGINGPYQGSCQERDPLGLITPASMVDLSAVLGIGMRIAAGHHRILLELRATPGLTAVERTSKHRVYSAGVGFAFPQTR